MTWLTGAWLAGMALSSAGAALAAVPDTQPAARLEAQYASLDERLQHNPFRRALVLDSSESASDLEGDIYALVDYPFPPSEQRSKVRRASPRQGIAENGD